MTPVELTNTLVDMGVDPTRAELAAKKFGELSDALDWLETIQDKPLEEVIAAEAAKAETDPNTVPADLEPGEQARSLVCGDCGRKLRSHAQVQFHANKTGHAAFSESTEEIAPLTEEEKKAKLEELRRKLAEKRSGTSEQDKAHNKRNEEIRRKSTKETQDIKEDLEKKEQLKEVAAKRKEKTEEIDAKNRIKAKIVADKEERRLRMEKEKAEREGRTQPGTPQAAALLTASGPVASKPASAYTETRLRLQLPTGTIQKVFSVDTTLFEVASVVTQDSSLEVVESFVQNFPKKVFDTVDFGATLKELELVPSASLIVK